MGGRFFYLQKNRLLFFKRLGIITSHFGLPLMLGCELWIILFVSLKESFLRRIAFLKRFLFVEQIAQFQTII